MNRRLCFVIYHRSADGRLRRRMRLPCWSLACLALLGLAGAAHLAWRLPDLAAQGGFGSLASRAEADREAWREALLAQHQRLAELRGQLEAVASLNGKLAHLTSLVEPKAAERAAGSAGVVEGGFGDEVRLSRQLAATTRALMEEVAFQEGRQRLLTSIMRERSLEIAAKPSLWPVRGPLNSDFGYRFMGRSRDFHNGVDIGTPVGTPVMAPADGTVSFVGYESGYGLIVVVEHRNGISTAYAHLRSAEVAPGEEVKRGARIAHSGMSGRTTGSHLHYEVRLNGQPVDPVNYMLN